MDWKITITPVASYNFTRRDKEVLFLIKQNLTNRDIAKPLFLSEFTIETQVKRYSKFSPLDSTLEKNAPYKTIVRINISMETAPGV